MVNKDSIVKTLKANGFIGNGQINFEPLEGGVSSDIYFLSDGVNQLVIKQALSKLQVEDDWYADVSRNQTEQAFIRYLQKIRPDAVPELLYTNADQQYFVMEYMDESFNNWKQQLLKGVFEESTARKAAQLLSTIHLQSWSDEQLQQTFDTTENFKSLRIEPYLVTTGKRHPELKDLFFEEARRLEHHREALVHGDFSPKNMMVKPERVVILDHEVAWFGDPVFDIAFLLNHLYLKMLYYWNTENEIQDLTGIFWDTYFGALTDKRSQGLKDRVGRLLLMLMLARVDGKSPVEYLMEKDKHFVRRFVSGHLSNQILNHSKINANWKSKLKRQI